MAKSQEPVLPPIEFTAAGDDSEARERNLESVLPSPGYPTLALLAAEIAEKRSETSVLDFTANSVNVRFQIDGVWHTMPAMDRQTGDYLAATLKQMAGMNYRDRRRRQEGSFQILYRRTKTRFQVVSQGVPQGERIAIFADLPKPDPENLVECGMREKQVELLKEKLREEDPSLTLVTALPGEGYTTVWRGVLSATDRLMRDYFVIEETSVVEPEVVNIGSITWDEAAGETPLTPIPRLLLREPNVLCFPDPSSGELVNQICDISVENELPILTRIPGKHAIDAVLRLLLLKPDPRKVVPLLKTVVAMRLIRTLCETCRVPFVPNPNLLAQLGLPAGRIEHLYRPLIHQPGMTDENGKEIAPCRDCQGMGYRGRTGLFELLILNEELRQAILTQPRVDRLSAVARSQRHVSIRDEGILLVARGVTSLEELQRVLKK